MHAKDLSGKDIVDSNGDKIGVVDDVEIDVMNKSVTGIIAKEGSLSSKLGMGEERMISMDMIDAIGDKVVLRRMERRM
ncbi:PRC-barrel domain-containing protein [Methanobacterium sp.]|uniref:PRC-barrel domain-containing protein n=1 Tax=Methanobacterium sp. TaxID=2164 RepID=UPI003C72A738